MSVMKLLARIDTNAREREGSGNDEARSTMGCQVAADPMTKFAIVLSALVHDLDHPGVPNGQLIKEDPRLARRYQEKSVAEQNSIDLAWKTLFRPEFAQLRDTLFSTESDLRYFRQILVNTVIATDIFDKELCALRKVRWNQAFDATATSSTPETSRLAGNRKATVIIESVIQASDVAHTMQHVSHRSK
jgi:3'5'-cyclic nucleotide phosphodiesterase